MILSGIKMNALEIEDIVRAIIGRLDVDEMYVCRCVNRLFMKVVDDEVKGIIRDDRKCAVRNWFKSKADIARWIYDIGQFTREEMMAGNNCVFRTACMDGYLKRAQWLDGRCNFTREEMMAGNNCAFRVSCACRYLEVAQWLDGRCQFTREEMMGVDNWTFVMSCGNGYLEIAQWLDGRCDFTREELMDVFDYCTDPSDDIGKWLMEVYASR